MSRRLLGLALLVALWVTLWEDLSWGNVLGGLAVGSIALFVAPLAPARSGLVLRPLAAIRFFLYFSWKLVEASLIVAWEVVTPRNRINEAIVAVPLLHDVRAIVTLLANSVSLTPGTLTLEATLSPPTLYIHVLHLKSVEEVRSDVRRLEHLAVRALIDQTVTDAGSRSRVGGGDER